MSANLFISGRIIWRADLKETRTGTSMRSDLIGSDDENMPPVRALIFGEEAEYANVGDFMSVEGPPEISTYEKNGEVKPAVSLMARWSRLTGHRVQRQRKSEAAKRGRGDSQRSPSGPPGPEPPPFDDELPL